MMIDPIAHETDVFKTCSTLLIDGSSALSPSSGLSLLSTSIISGPLGAGFGVSTRARTSI